MQLGSVVGTTGGRRARDHCGDHRRRENQWVLRGSRPVADSAGAGYRGGDCGGTAAGGDDVVDAAVSGGWREQAQDNEKLIVPPPVGRQNRRRVIPESLGVRIPA